VCVCVCACEKKDQGGDRANDENLAVYIVMFLYKE